MTTTETPTNDTAAPVAAAALLELLARYNVVDLARMPDAGPDNNELVALAERTGRPVLAAECPRPHMGNGAAGDPWYMAAWSLTAQTPAICTTNNLADLAGLALAHEDEHHGAGRERPFGWARYERTCAPDRPLDGLGDLCYFLGGEWGENGGPDASFTAHLLKLIAKADPGRRAQLERGFPREVLAWRVWNDMDPSPTAAGLCAALTELTGDRA